MWKSLWLLQKRLKRTCILDQMSFEMQLQMHLCTCAQSWTAVYRESQDLSRSSMKAQAWWAAIC